jgi:type VI secretion system protein ImpB
MGSESQQKKVGRVRPPRVQIQYDVQIGDAMEKVELPFVVGVMADLSGQPKEALPALKERKFVNIDRDNFNEVLKKAAPRLAMKVENRLANDDTKLSVELNFKNMDDFSPAGVVDQIEPLRELMRRRKGLNELLTKTPGNDKLEALLLEMMSDQEKIKDLAKKLESEAPKPETEKPQ